MNTATTLPTEATKLYDFIVSNGGQITMAKSDIRSALDMTELDLMIAEAYLSDRGLVAIMLNRKGGSGPNGRTLKAL